MVSVGKLTQGVTNYTGESNNNFSITNLTRGVKYIWNVGKTYKEVEGTMTPRSPTKDQSDDLHMSRAEFKVVRDKQDKNRV